MSDERERDLEAWYAMQTQIYRFRKEFGPMLIKENDAKTAVLFLIAEKGPLAMDMIVHFLPDAGDEVKVKKAVWGLKEDGDLILDGHYQFKAIDEVAAK